MVSSSEMVIGIIILLFLYMVLLNYSNINKQIKIFKENQIKMKQLKNRK